MSKDLARVVANNRNLQCLQLKPIGRFPPPLLEALSKLARLEFLSLNAWTDFQEYSLQQIMESCTSLLHLSLGENDFTQFTLETLRGSLVTQPRLPKSESPICMMGEQEMSVRLEQYDDPIKGRAGRYSEDLNPLEIHSKRAVAVDDTQYFLPILGSSGGDLDYSTMNKHYYFNNQLSKLKRNNQPDTPEINIRKLSLHQTGLRQEFLVNLTNQCPVLEHLSLLDGWGFYPTSRFATILSTSCPNLARLEFREQAMDLQDEFFVSLCQNIPRLQLIHAGTTGFSQGALEAVRAHCRDIVSLNFDGARGIQSKAVDQLLRVCSSLKVLSARGVVLNARDMDPGSRWVCTGLETLVIDVEIYAAILDGPSEQIARRGGQMSTSTLSQGSVQFVRKYVYDQLGDLTRLQLLGLGGGHRVRGVEAGVDLTLESGLQKLETLHCLERGKYE
ncbi:hypothetical protein BGZ76_010060 [Entomortierella beljakovae]|nr:hypothetical protein BGZ76_010060 [Entomortierella beljakovae]